ncbi:MAG: hypothetical protein M3156_06770 [Thermoproteota archaeon]|nr:hypothetical protein [Thermoproteota archaeon]
MINTAHKSFELSAILKNEDMISKYVIDLRPLYLTLKRQKSRFMKDGSIIFSLTIITILITAVGRQRLAVSSTLRRTSHIPLVLDYSGDT